MYKFSVRVFDMNFWYGFLVRIFGVRIFGTNFRVHKSAKNDQFDVL